MLYAYAHGLMTFMMRVLLEGVCIDKYLQYFEHFNVGVVAASGLIMRMSVAKNNEMHILQCYFWLIRDGARNF